MYLGETWWSTKLVKDFAVRFYLPLQAFSFYYHVFSYQFTDAVAWIFGRENFLLDYENESSALSYLGSTIALVACLSS